MRAALGLTALSLALCGCSGAVGPTSPASTNGVTPAASTTASAARPSNEPPYPSDLPALVRISTANAGRIGQLRTLSIDGAQAGMSQCSVAFSPDGTLLSGACFQTRLQVWDVASGRLAYAVDLGTPLVAVAFSPDGKLLATGGMSGDIRLYDAATGAYVRAVGHSAYPTWDLSFAPDGATIAAAGKGAGSDAGTGVELWDVAGTGLRWAGSGDGTDTMILSADYAPDGRSIAYGTLDSVLIVDAATGRELDRLNVGAHVGDVAYSSDGRSLAAGADDDDLHLWQAGPLEPAATLAGHTGYVNGVAFGPDGRLLVSGSRDGRIGVWDAQSATLLGWLVGHRGEIMRVAVDSSGTLIASIGWDGTVRLWGVPA